MVYFALKRSISSETSTNFFLLKYSEFYHIDPRNEALCNALYHILTHCAKTDAGKSNDVIIALPGPRSHFQGVVKQPDSVKATK
jgi:hypothetical protein